MRIIVGSLLGFILIFLTNVSSYAITTYSTITLDDEVSHVDGGGAHQQGVLPDDINVDHQDHQKDRSQGDGLTHQDLDDAPPHMQKTDHLDGATSHTQDQRYQDVGHSEGAISQDHEEHDVELTTADLSNRIGVLEKKHSFLDGQLIKFSATIIKLEKKVVELEEKERNSFYGKIRPYMDNLKDRLGPSLFNIVLSIIIVAFVFLLIYLMIPRRKKVSNVSYPRNDLANATFKKEDAAVEDVAAEEPESKINLARAYIEMGDAEKAKSILEEVLTSGSEEDKEEAKKLLSNVSSE